MSVAAEVVLTVCDGCGVSTDSKLNCPTCAKLGLSKKTFCGQECFKSSWPRHRLLHKTPKASSLHPSVTIGNDTMRLGFDPHDTKTWVTDLHLRRFLDFPFTGPLRPWPVTPQCVVPFGTCALPDYALDEQSGFPVGEHAVRKRKDIVVHTEAQVASLRKCCRLARMALDLAAGMISPGVTTDAIDAAVHAFCMEHGAYPSPLNYYKFPKSCCTSVNEVICHGIPDLRPLQEGDIVNVDITLYLDGYHGDLNETFFVGRPDEDSHRLVAAAYDCLMSAVEKCKPGMFYRTVGDIIHSRVDHHKLSVVRSYCGHGIGELFHTAPNVAHYRHNKAVGIMEAGQVFTIEPMINLGTFKDITWPDEWSAVTRDGKRSAQFEHTLLVTRTGVEVLTARLDASPSLGI
eukprot:Lankesteria_metandrocarpae@DN5769_c0_g1_i1.p1